MKPFLHPNLLLFTVLIFITPSIWSQQAAPSATTHTTPAPHFEVATIKPSGENFGGSGFRLSGSRIFADNTTVLDILKFAFNLQENQLTDIPSWASNTRFDIEGQPEGTEPPTDRQWRAMFQQLLIQRFGLTFHKEAKPLPTYAIVVAKSGPHLVDSKGDPHALPGLSMPAPGLLVIRNASIGDLANKLQQDVLDHPVTDQSGLTGRYDFQLEWAPDDTQHGGSWRNLPSDLSKPTLSTAIEEQLGLKLITTKSSVDVLAIDQITHPTAN